MKRTVVLLCLLLAGLTACGRTEREQPAASHPEEAQSLPQSQSPPPESSKPEDSEREVIDLVEEEARLSASRPASSAPESEAEPISQPEEPAVSQAAEPEPQPAADAEPPKAQAAPFQADLPAFQEAEPADMAEEQPAARSAAVAWEEEGAAVEAELLRLINQDRTEAGAGALGMQEEMQFAARLRAKEVLTSLSHTRPDGTAYHTAFDEADFAYAGKLHGENVLQLQAPVGRFTSEELAEQIYEKLRDSSGHYSNLLRDNFVQTGIGVHLQYDGDTLLLAMAQLFAGL